MSYSNGVASPRAAGLPRRYYIILGAVLALVLTLLWRHPDPRRFHAAYQAFKNPTLDDGTTRGVPTIIDSIPSDIKLSAESETSPTGQRGKGNGDYTATVVSGRLAADEDAVAWIHNELRDVTDRAIYIVDDPKAGDYHLEKNHGREAMVYLTYIVDHYDRLNDITFFFHTQNIAWHNNILMDERSSSSINRMNRTFVMEQGYVNTRCDHWPGCPSWVVFNPSNAEHSLDPHKLSDMFNEKLFGRLFPHEKDYPRYFAETCCSQFAASRDAIRAVPLEEWRRIKDWIEDEWADQYTGRAMEMMWQYIFKRQGVMCPSMGSCYCKQYGLCVEDDDPQGYELLRSWNEHRTRREELQWQEWFRCVAAPPPLRRPRRHG